MPNIVGILSPGDMGHTVGDVLRQNGLRVITCLQGRSQRTRQLAEKAGIIDVPTYPQFVTEADLILSIMVPAQAVSAATAVAETLQQVNTTLTYADCNAIAPQTVYVNWEKRLPQQAELSLMRPSSGHPRVTQGQPDSTHQDLT